ncbi:UNVERIFIED_CONTAM: hypothetical protein Sindi_1673600 [Sesamum indicum]
MWLAAVGGKNKDRVFGLGSKAHVSSHTFASPSPLPPPPPNPTVEDCIDRLKIMMANMIAMMRDAGLLLDRGTASDSPPASNQDDMDVAHKEELD